MLFHITYEFLPDHRDAAQDRFKETGGLPPEDVKMIGRWHFAEGHGGTLIAETDNPVSISKWTQEWTDLLSFQITPVLTDEQIMEVLK
jgi:hypothetical protein